MTRARQTQRRESGAALLIAMMIAALAAAIVVGLLWQQQVWLRQHMLTTDQTQARTLALAGINWARSILQDDARSTSIDHLGEYWAIRLPTTPLDNGEISGYIADQQALFNLNNMVQNGQPVVAEINKFRHLLSRLNLPETLADSALDWIDADTQPSPPGGAEDSYYRALTPPAWPPNRPLMRVAELGTAKGFDANTLARLSPFITALPKSTPVNVNTAPAEVLSAVVDNLALDRAAALAAQPRTFFSVAQFRSALPPGATTSDLGLDVKSQFFLITVITRVGATRGFARALVQRDGSQWPQIVWQVVE